MVRVRVYFDVEIFELTCTDKPLQLGFPDDVCFQVHAPLWRLFIEGSIRLQA